MQKALILLLLVLFVGVLHAQVWMPDNGDGTFTNPIIYADYSDPDVIRVGNDYYMVASSFTCQPGIPVLHSRDLVNWKIINHVYETLPFDRYKKPQHGQGSWAPSIRYHNGLYYVYFCTPEEGLFMASTADPAKKWTLHFVQDVANWEDPCPYWDDDGKAYLLRGKVGAGPAILHRMSADGKRLLDNGAVIFENTKTQPVLEGFKFLSKRDGFYYFSAPAGGVTTGWQSVFRSKNIYGPYEDKIVLQQGKTNINGPHQGGLVETQTGEWWFIHFQDKDAYGRIVHLQPAVWKDGWPVIGNDADGIGEPVMTFKKPNVGATYSKQAPQTSDNFNALQLGLQWQWQAKPNKEWYSLIAKKGSIRLNAINVPTDTASLFYAGNLLLQKFTAPTFTATTKLDFHPSTIGERAGLVVMGTYYTYISLEKKEVGNTITIYEGRRPERKYLPPKQLLALPINTNTIWFRVKVFDNATCKYTYSLNGINFKEIGERYTVEKGVWIGAKVGIVSLSSNIIKSKGYADFDFFDLQ